MPKLKYMTVMVGVILFLILFLALNGIRENVQTASLPDQEQDKNKSTMNSPEPVLTSSLPAVLSPTPTFSGETSSCIHTFEQFIFTPDVWASQPGVGYIPPSTPWQIEGNLPTPDSMAYISTMRSIGDIRELWIIGEEIMVYSPDTKLWKTIPRKYPEVGASMNQFFKTQDGKIWARTRWDFNNAHPISDQNKRPFLSLYNDATQKFEIITDELEINWIRLDSLQTYYLPPVIVLDQHDIFWIFQTDGTIYQFNPKSLVLIKQNISFHGFRINQAVAAPDGSIYLQKDRDDFDRLVLMDGDLLQFIPESGKIMELVAPSEAWPAIWGRNSLFVDRANRLWLNNLGYREPDGTWHTMFSEMPRYLENPGQPLWSMPALDFESSDGRLWFHRFEDGLADGTAWYDPNTGQGCVFTNTRADVVEDTDQTLWMLSDSKLYKLNLKK